MRLNAATIALLLLTACPRDPVEADPTTATPLGIGVVCKDRWTSDAEETDCQARFDDCSDTLTYELECKAKSCNCLANGDKLGRFTSSTEEDESACEVEDIGQLKILCGWNVPGVTRRIPVPE